MSLTLLSIGSTDLTSYIDQQNWDVNRTPVYVDWTDANHVIHRHVNRYRISGKFKIGFKSVTDVTSFLTLLENNRQSGEYYSASIFSNDDNTLHTAEIFLDGVASIKRDLQNGRVWHAYDITVEER
jgi:hypothetical protein